MKKNLVLVVIVVLVTMFITTVAFLAVKTIKLSDTVATLEQDIASLQTELKPEVEVTNKISSLESDVSSLKDSMGTLSKDVNELNYWAKVTREEFELLNAVELSPAVTTFSYSSSWKPGDIVFPEGSIFTEDEYGDFNVEVPYTENASVYILGKEVKLLQGRYYELLRNNHAGSMHLLVYYPNGDLDTAHYYSSFDVGFEYPEIPIEKDE